MCGIGGFVSVDSRTDLVPQLARMRAAVAHRGPDDQGLFIENNIGLGHRRLSILDVSKAGQQPFLSENGRYVMVYNGEIYNFKDFYPELKSNGFDIKTNSDTEVLLKLFELYGTKMLNRLNGMFAFVIWDKKEKKLTAIRDRMGVKPLYYSFYNETLYFASEQKALFIAGVPLKIAQNGIEEYIFNRFVEFFKYQSQILIIRKIIIEPVTKNEKPVLDTQDQHQVQSHPDHPRCKTTEMQFWFWNIDYSKVSSYGSHRAFIMIFKIKKLC